MPLLEPTRIHVGVPAYQARVRGQRRFFAWCFGLDLQYLPHSFQGSFFRGNFKKPSETRGKHTKNDGLKEWLEPTPRMLIGQANDASAFFLLFRGKWASHRARKSQRSADAGPADRQEGGSLSCSLRGIRGRRWCEGPPSY